MMDLKRNISKEEIGHLPPFVFSGEVVVVEDASEAERIAEFLQECPYLGFDTETRPAFRKGESYRVGLLQLASLERVYLFRLNKCGWGVALRNLLSDPKVIKIGVGIRDDLRIGGFCSCLFCGFTGICYSVWDRR